MDIVSLVAVGHVVENARLVDVDGGAMGACEQAVSFVVVHRWLVCARGLVCGRMWTSPAMTSKYMRPPMPLLR